MSTVPKPDRPARRATFLAPKGPNNLTPEQTGWPVIPLADLMPRERLTVLEPKGPNNLSPEQTGWPVVDLGGSPAGGPAAHWEEVWWRLAAQADRLGLWWFSLEVPPAADFPGFRRRWDLAAVPPADLWRLDLPVPGGGRVAVAGEAGDGEPVADLLARVARAVAAAVAGGRPAP